MPPGRGKPPIKCEVADCDRNIASHGLCGMHWKRMQRRGHTDKVERPRRPYIGPNGYVYERVEGERQGVLQHRLVMERPLGRPLWPDESVHHINGVKTDNGIENLEIWVRPQPTGIRASEALAWARQIIARYG